MCQTREARTRKTATGKVGNANANDAAALSERFITEDYSAVTKIVNVFWVNA